MQDFALTAYSVEGSADHRLPAQAPAGFYARVGKRVFDTGFALLLLPVLAPVILFLWILARRDGGPGFFGHTRVGRDGRPFKCWKVRSMVADAEARLQAHLDADPAAAAEWERDHKLANDPRISRLGHVLRKTSLDELPQIWNVLKGEMSFVGPRPIVTRELAKYGSSAPAYLAQKPGITGLWQVSARNGNTFVYRNEVDATYEKGLTLGMDLSVLFKTVGVVLKRTGC